MFASSRIFDGYSSVPVCVKLTLVLFLCTCFVILCAVADLERVAKELGEKMSHSELKEMIDRYVCGLVCS